MSSNKTNNTPMLTLRELCSELSISIATGRNWVKLGKLIPSHMENKTPYFTKSYIKKLKSEIISGQNAALKSRRNKKYISGNALYNSYVTQNSKSPAIIQQLLECAEESSIRLTDEVIRYLLADCFLHLISSVSSYCENGNLFHDFLNDALPQGRAHALLDELIGSRERALKFYGKHPEMFGFDYVYEEGEDIAGLLYISCKGLDSRKASGTYYTPTEVVRKLVNGLDIRPGQRILDPCCGTGNFLIQLPENVSFEQIYGNDTDRISVMAARLSLALKYRDIPVDVITEHITDKDFLTDFSDEGFDHIIGNPPWGSEFSAKEMKKLSSCYLTAQSGKIESYDIFIEKAINCLSIDGTLAFVLPDVILNIRAHSVIREIIMKNNSISRLDRLGNIFCGVQCPSIILQLKHTGQPFSSAGMQINDLKRSYVIKLDRNTCSDSFNFFTTDEEYQILEKIRNTSNCDYLLNNADFALGIVTGNNRKYITDELTEESEIVLKGTDISRFCIGTPSGYIIFRPEEFQQTASEAIYRAEEKLLYRFISNRLTFAYDNRQTLSLNSCNILIPRLEGVQIKYILAVLNSSAVQFFYKMEYSSIKVLRSHIESIPIPRIDEAAQNEIVSIVDRITKCLENGIPVPEEYKASDDCQGWCLNDYELLDSLIFDAFGLGLQERETVLSAIADTYGL